MIQLVQTNEDLIDLLEELNDAGISPVVAVLGTERYNEPVLAYGIDQGDTVDWVYVRDLGDDSRWIEGDGEEQPGKDRAEQPIEDLDGAPFIVLHRSSEFDPEPQPWGLPIFTPKGA